MDQQFAAKMIKFLIFFGILVFSNAESTSVSQCTSHHGPLPANTHIVGCSTPPCLLPQGQDAVINVSFVADRNITSMKTYATAYLLFIPFPHSLGSNSETCNFLDTNCPISQGQQVNYQLKMPIETYYPAGIQLPIELYVEDENSDVVFCLRVKIRVAPPVTQ